jgi:hypothetical protein
MHRVRGLDLRCREANALWVIEQVRDLARGAPARLHHHPVRVVFPRRLPRGERCRPDRRRGRSRAVPQSRAAAILELPVEPLCYTGEEFTELVRSPNPFIHQALAEGVRV